MVKEGDNDVKCVKLSHSSESMLITSFLGVEETQEGQRSLSPFAPASLSHTSPPASLFSPFCDVWGMNEARGDLSPPELSEWVAVGLFLDRFMFISSFAFLGGGGVV